MMRSTTTHRPTAWLLAGLIGSGTLLILLSPIASGTVQVVFGSVAYAAQAASGICGQDVARAAQGLRVSPVPLNVDRRDIDGLLSVGLGGYIVNGPGFCATCHTWVRPGSAGRGPWLPGGDPFVEQPKNINTAEFLAGGRPLPQEQGVFTSRNLTPDPASGLPGRPGMTEDEFLRVMKTGRDRHDGGVLLMQRHDYTMMSDRDLRAIYAYLKAVPTVDRDIPTSPRLDAPPPPTLDPLTSSAGVAHVVEWLMRRRAESPSTETCAADVERAARGLLASPVHISLQNRRWDELLATGVGSYYVNGPASCASCHTWRGVATPRGEVESSPGLIFGPPASSHVGEFMSGGQPFPGGLISRNLTPEPSTGRPGRPGMTEAEFMTIIKTGRRRGGGVLQFMQWPSYQEMTTEDLRAIYVYLRRVPSVAKTIPE